MTHYITPEQHAAYAASLVSSDADAPILECSGCGDTCDTYAGAHDEPYAVVRAFLEHAAFDHGSPRTVNRMTRTALVSFTTAAYPEPRFNDEPWEAPTAHLPYVAADGARFATREDAGEALHADVCDRPECRQ